MPKVKGSKQERMRVVPYRPWRAIFYRLGIVACLLLVGAGSYYLGYSRGIYENVDARAAREQLEMEVREYRRRVETLREELANSEQAHAVDGQALQELRESVMSLRESNDQLEEDILFYERIMSPESDESGLVVSQMDLYSTGIENRFRYRLELRQVGNNEQFIKGYANVDILGYQNGEPHSFPLRRVAVEEDQLDIKLEFRYFQNIQGEMVLPEGFVPDKVQILAVDEGDNAKTLRKSFGWVVQEPQ